MPLTHTKIKNTKPSEKQFKLFDGGGLFLLVKPNGGKYWRLKYRFNSKERLLALGVYPQVTLAEARRKRDDAKKLLAEGFDPHMQKQLLKSKKISFEVIALEWHKHKKGDWKENHAAKVLQSLEREVFPFIGSRAVTVITPPEMLAVIRKIEERGALELATRVLQRCNAIFKYAIQTGRLTYNPATDLTGVIKKRKVKHMNALKREELPQFLKDLENYQGSIITQKAIHFTLLTFVRTGELRGAKWKEFDIDKREWTIPASRMKMNEEHKVPIVKQSLAILEILHSITGHSEYLFPSERTNKKPISENTMIYGLYRMGYKHKATIHGFRSTASTILNEDGFNPDVIERQLAHSPRNKVRAAYNRAEYWEDRKVLMQAWADYLDSLLISNVIELKVKHFR